MTANIEPNFLIHQVRFIKSDDACIIADETDMADGLQLDQGDRPAVFAIHYLNPVGFSGLQRAEGCRQEEYTE
jgi:hypothetical protein